RSQRRKRVFLLGTKETVLLADLIWPPNPTHGNAAARRSHPALKPWENCSDAFRRAPAGDPNNVHMKHSDELVEAFRKTPANGGSRASSGRTLTCHKDHD